MTRQVREAIEIARGGGDNLLNSKDEYNRCLLPTLHVEGHKPLIIQEQENSRKEEPLTRIEEELAIMEAKKKLKKRLQETRESNPKPCKRRRKKLLGGRTDVKDQVDMQEPLNKTPKQSPIQPKTTQSKLPSTWLLGSTSMKTNIKPKPPPTRTGCR